MGWLHGDGAHETQGAQRRDASRALGRPLSGESKEQLDQIGEQDTIRSEQGLVSIKGEGGRIYYKHIDDLRPLDMRFVTAAERVEVGWLKERVERRKRGAEAPPIPPHLR